MNLLGWYLTDSAGNPTKWRFPTTNLNANSYMVVFASNKDRRTPGRPLHTSFKLNDIGSFVALVKPDGVTVQSAFTPAYPIQVTDVSYGFPFLRAGETPAESDVAVAFNRLHELLDDAIAAYQKTMYQK